MRNRKITLYEWISAAYKFKSIGYDDYEMMMAGEEVEIENSPIDENYQSFFDQIQELLKAKKFKGYKMYTDESHIYILSDYNQLNMSVSFNEWKVYITLNGGGDSFRILEEETAVYVISHLLNEFYINEIRIEELKFKYSG